MGKISILGVSFDAVTLTQAVDCAMKQLHEGRQGYVVTPNPEIVNHCRLDPEYCRIVNDASLVLPDGIGVIYASRILGTPLPQKVAGVEFASHLMEKMASEEMRLFLFGAKPGVAESAAQRLAAQYPGLRITGTRDGYYSDDAEAVESIRQAGHADVVFVCLGAPKQEKFIAAHRHELDATLFCGLGGSIDVFAGTAKRAPKIFIKLGMEWFYRLLKQPSRFGRMIKLPLFLVTVTKERLLHGRENAK